MPSISSSIARVLTRTIVTLSVSLACGACAENPPSTPEEVTVRFSVTVGDEPFVCGKAYAELGSQSSDMGFTDMRFYVHDVVLVDANGGEHPVTLADDGVWQRDGVAMLDFEDGCENGTQQTNTRITGTVPSGDYTGLRFSVGVPPALNSSETVLEGRGSPLNQVAMFWSWKSGYKYMRLDGDSGPFRLHLGASGCTGDFECSEMNIPRIELDGFSLTQDVVRLDLFEMLKGTDISQNTPSTAPGCMGESTDPDCQDIFERIGLGQETQHSAWTIATGE